MAQQLSSLRVVADVDTSAYVRSMAGKVSADRSAAESSKAVAAALAMVDAASTTASTALVRISRTLQSGYSGGADFARSINQIGGALQKGALDANRAGILVEAAYRKFGEMADVSQVAARGFAQLVPVVSQVNAELAAQAGAASEAAAALAKVEAQQAAIRAQGANQQEINKLLGVGSSVSYGGGARESASVFAQHFDEQDARKAEEAAAAAADYARQAEALTRQLDPAYAAQQRYNAAIFEAEDLFTAGALSMARYTQAVDAANAELQHFQSSQGMAESFAALPEAERDLREMAADAARFAAELDPVGAKLDAIAEKFMRVNELEKTGSLGPGAAQAMRDRLSQQYDDTNVGYSVNTQAAAEAENANRAKRAIDEQARSLIQLRAAYDPLAHAEDLRKERVQLLDAALAAGNIQNAEHAKGLAYVQHAYDVVDDSVKRTGNNVSLSTHQFQNLGFQVNDVLTMFASGASPFQIMATQSGQVIQILQQGRGGIAGSLKDIGTAIMSWITPTTVGVAGVVAGFGLLGAAIISNINATVQFERAISGVGAAAGLTAKQLEETSLAISQNSTATVGAARATAEAIVRAGAIVNQAQLTQVGSLSRSLQLISGQDAAQVNQMLGQAFRDPIRGVQTFNDLLGGLGYTTRRYIEDIRASRGEQAANQALIDQITPRIRMASELTTQWAGAWQSLYAAASRFFEYLGSRGGPTIDPVNAQIEGARDRLTIAETRLQERRQQATDTPNAQTQQAVEQAIQVVEQYRRRVDELTASQQRNAQQQQQNTQTIRRDREQSRVYEQSARDSGQLPGGMSPDVIRDMANSYREAYNMRRDWLERWQEQEQQGGRIPPAELAAMQNLERTQAARRATLQAWQQDNQQIFDSDGQLIVSNERLVETRRRNVDLMEEETRVQRLEGAGVATNNRSLLEQAEAARAALRARQQGLGAGDPEERAAALREQQQQRRDRERNEETQYQRERTNQIREQQQGQEAANTVIGRSVYEQNRVTEATRMTIEAQREYRRIYGETAQMPDSMRRQIEQDAERMARLQQEGSTTRIFQQMVFDRRTIGLSEEDVKIAQQLRDIYGTDIPAALHSTEAAYIRMTDTLRQTNDLFRDSFGGFFRDLATGTSAADAFKNALSRIAGQLADMAARQLWALAFGGGGAGGGGFGGFISSLFGGSSGGFGAGAAAAAAAPMLPVHPLFAHGGATIGASGGYFNGSFSPSLWQHAPRYQAGYLQSNEIAAILHRNETVLTEQQARRAASMMTAGAGAQRSGPVITFAPQVNVAMPQGARPEDGQGFGREAARTMQDMFRNMLAEETRVGGVLNPAA